MKVCGRGLSAKAVVVRTDSAGGVVYRVDDESNPAAWYELHLTTADIQDAVYAIAERAADGDGDEDLEDTTLAIEPGGE